MIERFAAGGYPASHLRAIDMEPNDGSNSRAAQRFIAPSVEGLLALAKRRATTAGCRPPTKVDIVAHSMGTLSARWYVSQMDATVVANLVGIAPANHGTDALCGYAGDGNRELCPAFAKRTDQSEVQIRLNGAPGTDHDETPYGTGTDSAGRRTVAPTDDRRIHYWTIRLDPDEWIRPAASAILDGAGGRPRPSLPAGVTETSPGNILWPSGVSHDDLPRDSRLTEYVLQLLSDNR